MVKMHCKYFLVYVFHKCLSLRISVSLFLGNVEVGIPLPCLWNLTEKVWQCISLPGVPHMTGSWPSLSWVKPPPGIHWHLYGVRRIFRVGANTSHQADTAPPLWWNQAVAQPDNADNVEWGYTLRVQMPYTQGTDKIPLDQAFNGVFFQGVSPQRWRNLLLPTMEQSVL